MSLLRNLTGITTPASNDLFYVVQNNTDYKMTSEQFMNFAKSAIVVSLTQAQYDALTPAEKSNGSIYLINDATLSASDIAYGQGTVEDSLDELGNKIIATSMSFSSALNTAMGSSYRSAFLTADISDYNFTRIPKIFIQPLSNIVYPIGILLLETDITLSSFRFALVSPQSVGTVENFTINILLVDGY